MSGVPQFQPHRQIEASRNLVAFVRSGRAQFAEMFAERPVAWDDPVWPGARWTKLHVGQRRDFEADEQLDPAFGDFAKAYVVSRWAERPGRKSALSFDRSALRCIEQALLTGTRSGSIQGLTWAVLDQAAEVAREHFSESARYHVGRAIRAIAVFVSERSLVPRDLSMWRSPIARSASVRRTGAAGDREAARKLPSRAGLDALAEVFANDPQDPQPRFVSAVAALLLSAPWRIGELLALHVDAQCKQHDDTGVLSYGFSYYGKKGFGHAVKFIPTVMVPVAQEAIRRIREMTESARALARHLERTPHTPLLYHHAPDVDVDHELTLEQKVAYLRRPPLASYRSAHPDWGFRTIAEHWERSCASLPAAFPAFPRNPRLAWSQALFCFHPNALHETRAVDWYQLWAPRGDIVNALLGSARNKVGVFGKLGYSEADGAPIRMRTHQFRHYLSTVAERGAMAHEDLAQWAGRALAGENAVYNHMTQSERAERARSAVAGTALAGPQDSLRAFTPVARGDSDWAASAPTHRTEFGRCTLDWAMTPCTKYRDCLLCSQHECRKGDAQALERIRIHHDHNEAECRKALDALVAGVSVADRWLEHSLKSLIRQAQLLELMESEDIEDGTPIRLTDASAEHSHLRRALDQRLPQLRDPALPQVIRELIENHTSGRSPQP